MRKSLTRFSGNVEYGAALARSAFHGFSTGFQRCKSVYILQISSRAFQRVFTCKIRPRYSRERAPRRLGGNFNSLFTSPCPYTRAESLRASDCALSQAEWALHSTAGFTHLVHAALGGLWSWPRFALSFAGSLLGHFWRTKRWQSISCRSPQPCM